jgi:hypothetical protein
VPQQVVAAGGHLVQQPMVERQRLVGVDHHLSALGAVGESLQQVLLRPFRLGRDIVPQLAADEHAKENECGEPGVRHQGNEEYGGAGVRE